MIPQMLTFAESNHLIGLDTIQALVEKYIPHRPTAGV
jgi:hypothetical protein